MTGNANDYAAAALAAASAIEEVERTTTPAEQEANKAKIDACCDRLDAAIGEALNDWLDEEEDDLGTSVGVLVTALAKQAGATLGTLLYSPDKKLRDTATLITLEGVRSTMEELFQAIDIEEAPGGEPAGNA